MKNIRQLSRTLRDARLRIGLTQRELANRIGTSQPAIAHLERGDANPTVETLWRLAAACGYSLQVTLQPLPVTDAVVERYKLDVDRTLLRENLRRSVDERLRTLAEWQIAVDVLQRATTLAKQSSRAVPRAT